MSSSVPSAIEVDGKTYHYDVYLNFSTNNTASQISRVGPTGSRLIGLGPVIYSEGGLVASIRLAESRLFYYRD